MGHHHLLYKLGALDGIKIALYPSIIMLRDTGLKNLGSVLPEFTRVLNGDKFNRLYPPYRQHSQPGFHLKEINGFNKR